MVLLFILLFSELEDRSGYPDPEEDASQKHHIVPILRQFMNNIWACNVNVMDTRYYSSHDTYIVRNNI